MNYTDLDTLISNNKEVTNEALKGQAREFLFQNVDAIEYHGCDLYEEGDFQIIEITGTSLTHTSKERGTIKMEGAYEIQFNPSQSLWVKFRACKVS